MDFQKLVDVYDELEKTSSGNKMREILSEFFKKVSADELTIVSYLTLGQIASEYESVVLGLADKSALKSISLAGGIDQAKVKKLMQETGDAGLVAEKVMEKKPRTLVPLGRLTIQELFEKLHQIAQASGGGSQEQKTNLLASLLQKASPRGAKYVVRIALGTLRLGVGDMTILDALAIAFTGEKKNKEILEAAYNICPDVRVIAETLAKKGLKGLEKIDLRVGRPIKMMLAQRVKELKEIPEKILGKVAVEAKYDGERIQAHKDRDGKIILFSRRLDNITAQFPDLVGALEKQIQGKDFVIEGEVIAIDQKGRPLPFQTLMQRRRKYQVEKYTQEIPTSLKLFDLLYLNGESFLHRSYQERTAALEKAVLKSRQLLLAERMITDEMGELNHFFQKMLRSGYEGVIVKSLTGEYQAGTRGWNWIKWKKEYAKEMSDTLDLVVVGAFHGKGKRRGTYGALLCAAYNEKEDRFETVCKLGTGLTDELLAGLPRKLERFRTDKKPARLKVKKEMEPEVWFEPKTVVEVFGAEITKSPFHTSGLALRFPRFIRFREDKKAEQATTSQELEQIAKRR